MLPIKLLPSYKLINNLINSNILTPMMTKCVDKYLSISAMVAPTSIQMKKIFLMKKKKKKSKEITQTTAFARDLITCKRLIIKIIYITQQIAHREQYLTR